MGVCASLLSFIFVVYATVGILEIILSSCLSNTLPGFSSSQPARALYALDLVMTYLRRDLPWFTWLKFNYARRSRIANTRSPVTISAAYNH